MKKAKVLRAKTFTLKPLEKTNAALARALSLVSKVDFSENDIIELKRRQRVKNISAGHIEVTLELSELKKRSRKVEVKASLNLGPADILFEDDIIIVVKKPSAIPSQPTLDPQRESMQSALARYLEQRDGRLGYLALHHRLDGDTSGALLFCRKKSFNKEVGELFSERLIRKVYLAVVSGNVIEDKFRVHNFLAKSKDRPLRSIVVKSGGQVAITDFTLLHRSEGHTLLRCELQTGRMHQIRAHLSSLGHPIIGDRLYGGAEHSRLMLHAFELGFKHPKSGEQIVITCPPPREFENYS